MPAATPLDHGIVRTVMSAHADVTGEEPVVRGMPYGADMHLLVNQAHIPTLLYGPGDVRRAHAPDEFVPIADLETAAQTLVLAILRTCGVAGG
jgi:acetylornithine deacetylase